MASLTATSIVTIVVTIIALAIMIYNVVYVGSLRNSIRDNPAVLGPVLSETGADVLFWLDIGLIVVLVLFLIYSMFVVFTSKSDQDKIREFLTRSQAGKLAVKVE